MQQEIKTLRANSQSIAKRTSEHEQAVTDHVGLD